MWCYILWLISEKTEPDRFQRSHLVFSGLTQMSLLTRSTSPATEAVSFSSSMYVPWPLKNIYVHKIYIHAKNTSINQICFKTLELCIKGHNGKAQTHHPVYTVPHWPVIIWEEIPSVNKAIDLSAKVCAPLLQNGTGRQHEMNMGLCFADKIGGR